MSAGRKIRDLSLGEGIAVDATSQYRICKCFFLNSQHLCVIAGGKEKMEWYFILFIVLAAVFVVAALR